MMHDDDDDFTGELGIHWRTSAFCRNRP